MKEVKKMLNAKLKRHLARPHALPHEIYIYIDDYSFMIGLYHTYKISIDFLSLFFFKGYCYYVHPYKNLSTN